MVGHKVFNIKKLLMSCCKKQKYWKQAYSVSPSLLIDINGTSCEKLATAAMMATAAMEAMATKARWHCWQQ